MPSAMIPSDQGAILSPLLVKAAQWPDESEVSPVPWKGLAERPEDHARFSAGEWSGLKSSLKLLHSGLKSADPAARAHWNAAGRLFYKLEHTPPDPLPADGDPYAAWAPWTGWASWAPASNEKIRAFSVVARHESRREGASGLEIFHTLLGEVFSNAFRDEVLRCKVNSHPDFTKPEAFSAIVALDPMGCGLLYHYLYAYTNGQILVAALQVIAHETE